jgi:hypothetical protein
MGVFNGQKQILANKKCTLPVYNQTWQWEINHLYLDVFPNPKPPLIGDFPASHV